MDILKQENASLRAERLDNIKENDARVLIANKTELEALAVAHGSAEELKELKSHTVEQDSKMRDEVFNLSAQFQEINRDHASIKEELSNLKTYNKSVNINDLKRTIIELDAKVEKHAALSIRNFISLNEPISPRKILVDVSAEAGRLMVGCGCRRGLKLKYIVRPCWFSY